MLINSRNTVNLKPMATLTSIRESMQAIGARMDKGKDILFLFLTSHGSKEHDLSLAQKNMDIQSLPAKELGALLQETGIRWKVIVVSACYSGGFIDAVKDDRTLVITATRRDRTSSFGCADDTDLTYFGRAFFKEVLPRSNSFQDAFHQADTLVREWEAEDLKTAKDASEDGHSFPQMNDPPAIRAYLQRWWSEMRAARTKHQLSADVVSE